MRKNFSVLLLLLVAAISGCNQEKAQVETYLNALTTSNEAMKAIAKEMETSMGGLREEISGGSFDAEKIKEKLKGFEGQMNDQKKKVEGLSVPEKCKVLHDTTVEQYQTAIEVLGKTPGMIDIAKKMSDVAEKLKKDPKQMKALQPEMTAAQEEMMKIQMGVMELAKKGQELDGKAKAERKKLEEEFKIPAAATSTPAPSAGGSTPAPAASPSQP
jgi:chromosome segregation ATPase